MLLKMYKQVHKLFIFLLIYLSKTCVCCYFVSNLDPYIVFLKYFLREVHYMKTIIN